MTVGGWLILTSSLGAVWGLAIFCFRKVLTASEPVAEDDRP